MRPSSPSPSPKDLSVYDFDAAEEAVETLSEKFKSRLESKRPTGEPIDKYAFLQSFVDNNFDQTDVANVSCMDSPERDDAQASCAVAAAEEGMLSLAKEISELDEHGHMGLSEFGSENPEEAEEEEEAEAEADVISDDDDDDDDADDDDDDDDESWAMDSQTPSPSVSPFLEEEGLPGSPSLYDAAPGEPYDDDMAEVMVFPDYILYGNTLYWDSRLIFSEDCIRIEYSESSNASGSAVLEWSITDIVQIDSQWSQCVEVANVQVSCSSTSAAGKEKMHDDSDIMKVMFSVTDKQWLGKEQKIISLAQKYKDIWRACSDDHLELTDAIEEPTMFMPIEYFDTIEEPFEDVIYPKGNPNAVSVSKRDLELLEPGIFINDTIIDFYIEYLKNKIQPSERHRFHFFNSFFFRKLADLDKDPGSALEGKAAFQRVRKWTRKVNMFEYDYIFIPVNFNLHWSLLVICHPGEIAVMGEDGIEKSVKVPCVLHMNSIKGTHTGLERLIQCYLHEEWKERHPENNEDFLSNFSNLRFVSLDLPQQENSFDCGLFLLHYVESFLNKAPNNFSPFRITKFSVFLTEDWFVPAEASHKRSFIRKLIYDLIGVPSRRLPPATHRNSHLPFGYTAKELEQEALVDFPSENCSAAKVVSTATESRIEIKLLTTSSAAGVSECDKEGMVLQDFFTLRETAEYSTESTDYPFQSSAPSRKLNSERGPAEEYAVISTLTVSNNLNKEDHQLLDEELTAQICSSFQCEPLNKPDISVGAYETSWMPLEVEEVDMHSSSKSLNNDHVVSDSKDETVPQSLPENCGYVLDTPTASYDEKLKSCFQDSQEIDAIKAEGEDCEGFQRVDSTMVDYGGVENCRDTNTAETEIGYTENSQNTTSKAGADVEDWQTVDCSNAEGAASECFKPEDVNRQDYAENDTNKVDRVNGEDDTDKADRVNGEDDTDKADRVNGEDDTDKADKVNGEDSQEIGTHKGGGNGEVQKLDTADAGIGGNSDSCSKNIPPQSFEDVATSDDEISLEKNACKRRDEPGARVEQKPLKRRKIMLPEGGKRQTRSHARNCLP